MLTVLSIFILIYFSGTVATSIKVANTQSMSLCEWETTNCSRHPGEFTPSYLFLTKITGAHNEAALSYDRMRGYIF